MYGRLHDLDRRVVAHARARVGGKRHLRQAEGARIWVLARADDLEDGHHGEGHVGRPMVGPVGAETEVDVEEGRSVPVKPTWLQGDGAASCGPEGAVGGGAHAAAWVRTLC